MGKKPHSNSRPKINNYNPYNKLSLNKFHQISDADTKRPQKNLQRKKRDLERLLKYREHKGEEIRQDKEQQLNHVTEKLQIKKKKHQKDKRKEFFIKNQYHSIMNVELKKISRKLNVLRAEEQTKEIQQETREWLKKMNYIKHFPKTLKYVSLFPTNKPLQPQAIEFQNKIMEDIDRQITTKKKELNSYAIEDGDSGRKKNRKKQRKDDFFIEAGSSDQAEGQDEEIEEEEEGQ